MEFEYFLYIIILFIITLSYVGISIGSQIMNNSSGTTDPTSALINSLKTGNVAGAFNSILSSIAGKTVKTALVPVLDNMATMLASMNQMKSNIQSGNKMIDRSSGFAFNAINDFKNQIYNVIGAVQEMVLRIMFMIKRMISVFIVIVYGMRSSLAIGESFNHSIFGKILRFFCFKDNTILELQNGNYKHIRDIKLGDILKYDGKVTGIVKCKAKGVRLYLINGNIVSSEHLVLCDNIWIHVRDHPKAIEIINKEQYLYNIETENKTITMVNGDIYKDYDDDGIIYRTTKYIYSLFKSTNEVFNNMDIIGRDYVVLEYKYIDDKTGVHKEQLMYYNPMKNQYEFSDGEPIILLNSVIYELDKIIYNNI